MIYFKVIIYIIQALSVFFLCSASYFAGISHQLKKDIKERARRFETDELRVRVTPAAQKILEDAEIPQN